MNKTLDPMFKALSKESPESKQEIKRLTIAMYKKFFEGNPSVEELMTQTSSKLVESQPEAYNSLFASFLSSEVPVEAVVTTTIEEEVELYDKTAVGDRTEMILFWRNMQSFPKLKKLAQKILSIQASSVASESAFSTQGNIQTNERTRLTSEHVEQLLFLHYFYLDKYKTDKCPSKKK